jgi:hypothetical protein
LLQLLLRITPDGCKPVSGASPTAAWQELYKAAAGSTVSGASAAAAASVCGAKLFGLQHRLVQALVQALPNAAACDKFMAWHGEPPQPVLLVRAHSSMVCLLWFVFVCCGLFWTLRGYMHAVGVQVCIDS